MLIALAVFGANQALGNARTSYVVMSAIAIALVCGTWLARGAAALDFAVLVAGGHIFDGLSQLQVSAVGHLTALVTAAAAVTLTVTRRVGRWVSW